MARTAAERFAKLSLELGGKNAVIVTADAVATAASLKETVAAVVRAGFSQLNMLKVPAPEDGDEPGATWGQPT